MADTSRTSSADGVGPSGSDNPENALHSGEIVDLRYRIKRRIGRGGMGAVYLVDDLQEEVQLALKQIYKNRTHRGVLLHFRLR